MADSTEYFWGVELSKETPTYTWTFEEEDEDADYMLHTLFLKNAILGTSAVKGERNLIQIETKNFEKKDLKQPFLSLTLGQADMCSLDVSFGHESPVTFRLVEGSGPIALGGQQLVEFPPDELMSQDAESADDDSVEESELTEEESPKKLGKRKAGKDFGKKAKKGKMDESQSSADDSEEDEEEDESEEDEEDEEEDMEEGESSPEKGKKKKAKGRTILTVTVKSGKQRRVVKAHRRK